MLSITEIMENAPKGYEDHSLQAQVFLDCVAIFDDVRDFWGQFEESYSGLWESEAEFAQQLAEDAGLITNEDTARYFDYDLWTRDLFLGDYWSETILDEEAFIVGVAVFRTY